MTAAGGDISHGAWRLLRPSGADRTGSLVRAADLFVRNLRLRKDATWTDLQRAVEAVYRKRILLIASAHPGLRAVTGLWIDAPEFGVVVCRESDEPHYQAQNAFHELAHILFATAPADWFTPDLPRTPAESGQNPTLLCAFSDEQTSEQAAREAAVEAVAFAMARAVQTLNRTSEEAYFG